MGSKRATFHPSSDSVNSTLEPAAFKVEQRNSQGSFREDLELKLIPFQGNFRADSYREVNLNRFEFCLIICLKFGSSAGLGGHGGFPGAQHGHRSHPANGILVGPGGPTGLIGRPYGQGYPQQGFGGFGFDPKANFGFEGQHNGLGQGPYQGSPYGNQFGGPGGFQGPLFDPANFKNLQAKKVEKSAK